MAKRKMDCSLDNIVMEHLKKSKCEKTSKMFGDESLGSNDHSKLLKNFIKFMKQKETEKENRFADDLGFEINYGAFQPMTKVSFCRKCFNCRHFKLCIAINYLLSCPERKQKSH